MSSSEGQREVGEGQREVGEGQREVGEGQREVEKSVTEAVNELVEAFNALADAMVDILVGHMNHDFEVREPRGAFPGPIETKGIVYLEDEDSVLGWVQPRLDLGLGDDDG